MSEEEDAAIAVLLAIADIDNAPLINPFRPVSYTHLTLPTIA